MKIFSLLFFIACSLNTIQASGAPGQPLDSASASEVQGQSDGRHIPVESDQPLGEIAEDPQPQPRPANPLGAPLTIRKTQSKRREKGSREPVNLAQRSADETKSIIKGRRLAIDWGVPHNLIVPDNSWTARDFAFHELSEKDQTCLRTAQIFLGSYLESYPNFEQLMILAWREPVIKGIFYHIAHQKLSNQTPLATNHVLFRRIYETFKPASDQNDLDFIWFVAQIYNTQVTFEQVRDFVQVIALPQLAKVHPMGIVATIKRHVGELDRLTRKLGEVSRLRQLMAIEITNPQLEIFCDVDLRVLSMVDPKVGILKQLAAAKEAAESDEKMLEFALAEELISQRQDRDFLTDLHNYLTRRDFSTLEREELRFIGQDIIQNRTDLLRKVIGELTSLILPDDFILDSAIHTLEGALTAAFLAIERVAQIVD